ncbi:MAG: nucleoside-diphosphate kinase [bacterium]
MERTCMLIKPDGVSGGHIGEITARIEEEGFAIRGLRMLRLSRTEAEAFYAIHAERPFFGELVDYMTGGPIVALALEREDAVGYLREVIGATDPAEAAPGTIRALFGTDVGVNTVHGSDSPENGVRETLFFFPEGELADLGGDL